MRPGEPFFFKTHAPHNRVVGGGFFGGAARLHASEAWDLLGPANGAISLGQMLDRIAHYRREPRTPGEDPVIGCIFIRDVTFFPDDLTFDPPPDFSSNVVQGKTYDMGDERYGRYFGDLMQMVLGVAVELDLTQPWHRSGPVFGDPRLAPSRLGQQAFKAVVGDAYHWRCAITGAKIRPVLEACHAAWFRLTVSRWVRLPQFRAALMSGDVRLGPTKSGGVGTGLVLVLSDSRSVKVQPWQPGSPPAR